MEGYFCAATLVAILTLPGFPTITGVSRDLFTCSERGVNNNKQVDACSNVATEALSSKLSVEWLNCRSICNKTGKVSETIEDGRLDVLVASKTWHHTSDDISLREATPIGYLSLMRFVQRILTTAASQLVQVRSGPASATCHVRGAVHADVCRR